jgi:uncharacterized protein (TIGR00369 family)
MGVFDRFPPPATAQLLGAELVSESPSDGTIEMAFNPNASMLNPAGVVQGGIVAAMLDDTMGPALISLTGGKVMPSSIDLNVSFIRPVKPGRVIAKGRVVNRGRSIVFLEAELFDSDGRLLARSTSSAIPVEIG